MNPIFKRGDTFVMPIEFFEIETQQPKPIIGILTAATISAASGGAFNFSLNTSAATKIFKSRVNGSNVTPTSVLNNSSAALTSQFLYVGSRAGSTLYSNMKCYSIVGIGRNLTTIESNLIEGIQTEPFV